MPDVTYADFCAAVKTMRENNPPMRCRVCGSGFYLRRGIELVGTGLRPWLESDDLCEDCDFGEGIADMRTLVLHDMVAICERYGVAFDAQPGSAHWQAADDLARRIAAIFSQTADPPAPSSPSGSE